MDTHAAPSTDFSGPLEWYWHFSQRPDFEADPAQLRVLERLEALHDALVEYKAYRAGAINRILTNMGGGRRPPRGLYIWGSVGRGKSLLMDAFFNVSPLTRKRRIHFHDFMHWVHAELRQVSGKEDPLDVISTQIAKKLRLLCFDEFHVSDIADAMILGRLVDQLTEKGVVIVLTSNYPPDRLYPNGLQRERFLPAIKLLQERLDVLEIEGRMDHRRRVLESMNVYHTPANAGADAALAEAFDALSRAAPGLDGDLEINGHKFHFKRRNKGIVWFDFAELCARPRSQMDYLEIAREYHTVLVSGIPVLHARNNADIVRRLTWLIDVFYDTRVKLVASAADAPEMIVHDPNGVPPGQLLAASADEGALNDATTLVSAEFARTASRMREMQSKAYFAEDHRPAAGL
jgi:cell division protein ZapE